MSIYLLILIRVQFYTPLFEDRAVEVLFKGISNLRVTIPQTFQCRLKNNDMPLRDSYFTDAATTRNGAENGFPPVQIYFKLGLPV